ncbi:MAG: prepilin peptidase [Gammaproteobacteria bacterium]|nr:prepilin peptidase [Gammaproteobacteria bacterium]
MSSSLWMSMRSGVWQQLSTILLLMVVLVPAAIGDYQRHRVPNWLSMSGWVIAPLVAWLFAGLTGIGDSLLGLGLMLVLILPLWLIHWFGAADVKLIGTVGAFVGLSDSLLVLFGILLTGLAMALLLLLGRAFFSSKQSGSGQSGKGGVAKEGIVLPYAIPIAFGTLLTLLYLQLAR